MEIQTGVATQCSGGGHYHLPVTIGGETFTLVFDRADLQNDPDEPRGEQARERLLHRVRSAIKEAGATTPAQARTAISNKTFHV